MLSDPVHEVRTLEKGIPRLSSYIVPEVLIVTWRYLESTVHIEVGTTIKFNAMYKSNPLSKLTKTMRTLRFAEVCISQVDKLLK